MPQKNNNNETFNVGVSLRSAQVPKISRPLAAIHPFFFPGCKLGIRPLGRFCGSASSESFMVPGVFFCSPILEPWLKRASRAPRGGKLMKHDKHQQKSMDIFGKVYQWDRWFWGALFHYIRPGRMPSTGTWMEGFRGNRDIGIHRPAQRGSKNSSSRIYWKEWTCS